MFKENFSLKRYNTFGIDAAAQYFSTFKTVEQLEQCLEMETQKTKNRKRKTLILGGGSNILLSGNVEGFVLKNEIKGIEIVSEDDDDVY
ncbi:MAG: UDP-N-acetylenolpyruvoylglucosamine reductase, partial [Ferruginibacter sp.]|nr:UDP-N-acetylenolpyruvoylglucosamine reductase [Ferruginibacter sp.]